MSADRHQPVGGLVIFKSLKSWYHLVSRIVGKNFQVRRKFRPQSHEDYRYRLHFVKLSPLKTKVVTSTHLILGIRLPSFEMHDSPSSDLTPSCHHVRPGAKSRRP